MFYGQAAGGVPVDPVSAIATAVGIVGGEGLKLAQAILAQRSSLNSLIRQYNTKQKALLTTRRATKRQLLHMDIESIKAQIGTIQAELARSMAAAKEVIATGDRQLALQEANFALTQESDRWWRSSAPMWGAGALASLVAVWVFVGK